MKKTAILILTVLMLLTAVSAVAETRISVGGSGTTLVNADYAMVTLGVVHIEKDVLNAQEKVNSTINAIRAALIESGVSKEDINTDQVRINARYDYSGSVEKIVGYSASSYLVIRTNDMENVGSVIDIAFGAGANTLDGIEFFAENTESAREESLNFAVTDARKKAEIIAKAAGLNITGIDTISESYSYTSESSRNAVFKNAVAEDSMALGATVVQSAKLSVEASVTIVFIAE
ncbi:MAG: SIMPL domain-containing protein [Clostridia bacterium]|nr:SIMPL domain-containing protein [Clostridia bacterium]